MVGYASGGLSATVLLKIPNDGTRSMRGSVDDMGHASVWVTLTPPFVAASVAEGRTTRTFLTAPYSWTLSYPDCTDIRE